VSATPGQADPWQVITDVMSELIRGGQTADIRCRAALSVFERAGIDFDGNPVALAAREPRAADGTWTTAECLERIGDLAGALHEIKQAYAPGTFAHDLAHATLDQGGPEPRPAPGLADPRPASMLRPVDFDDEPETQPLREPQPAPELAALRSPVAALIGMWDGMGKIYAPSTEEWEDWRAVLGRLVKELAEQLEQLDPS